MSVYLASDQIKGNVTSPPYTDHILLHSVKFSIDSTHLGTMSESDMDGVFRPVMGGFIISKPVDISSPSIFKEATSGKFIPSIALKFSTITGDKLETFMMYTLSDCQISNYAIASESTDDNDKPMETFTIIYNKIMYKFVEFDKNDKPIRPITVGYDLRKGMSL